MKKKILFFIETLQCGGAEKSLVSLLQLIDFDKADVDLMLLHPESDDVFRRYVPSQVNVIPLPVPNLLHKPASLAYAMRWRMLKSLGVKRHNAETLWPIMATAYHGLNKKYDVAIAYQQGFPTYYVAKKVTAHRKLAWVNIDLNGAGYRESFNRPYYNHYDNVIAVSGELFDRLSESAYVDKSKLVTVYDILNVDLIRSMATDDIAWPWPDSDSCDKPIRLVTVGRLSKQKNYPLAVKAAAELRNRGMNFEWCFVGDGDERSVIENLIKHHNLENHVRLAGLQPNPYPLMAQADVYVHTASFEGFGLTLAEARILGKPVVSTNFRIVYDQISDGVNGLITEMNAQSVADAISRISADTDLFNSIVENVNRENNTTAKTEIEKFNSLVGI